MEQSTKDSKAAAAAASKSARPSQRKSKGPGPSSLSRVVSASTKSKRPSGTGPTAAAPKKSPVPPPLLATEVVRTVKKNKIKKEVEKRFQLTKHDVLKYSPAFIRRKEMFEGIFKQCDKDQKNLEKQLEDLRRKCNEHRKSWKRDVKIENGRLYRQARFELKRQVEKEEREGKLEEITERPAALSKEQERRKKIVQNEVASDLWNKFIQNDNVRVINELSPFLNKLSIPFREELKGYYDLFKPTESRKPHEYDLADGEDDPDFRIEYNANGIDFDSIYLKVRNEEESDELDDYYWIQINNSIQFVKSFHRFTLEQDAIINNSRITRLQKTGLYGKKKRKGTVSKNKKPKKKSRKKNK